MLLLQRSIYFPIDILAAPGARPTSRGSSRCPVCVFDGERIEVIPDFLVAHRLGDEQSAGSAWPVIATLPPVRKAFTALGRPLSKGPAVQPAPKVWVTEGDALVEYGLFLGGALGFELLREAASTIGIAPKTERLETNDIS